MSFNISMDLDETMASSLKALFDRINQEYRKEIENRIGSMLSVEDIETYDDWGEKFRKIGLSQEEYIKELLNVWETDYHSIETHEPLEKVRNQLSYLHKEFYLDIVTENPKDKSVKSWLDLKNIEKGEHYGKLVSVPKLDGVDSKAELGYDVYIDDKPSMVDELYTHQALLLYTRPYNKKRENRIGPLVKKVSNMNDVGREMWEYLSKYVLGGS